MENRDLYTSMYGADSRYGKRNWGAGAEEFLKRAGAKSICDIGCGAGVFCVAAAGWAEEVHGVDIASPTAGATIPDERVTYHEANATELPLFDESIDWVTSFDMLEHLQEPDALKAIEEMVRVARVGVVVSVSDRKLERYQETLHETVHPVSWWFEKFRKHGRVTYYGRVERTGLPYIVLHKSKKSRIAVYTALIGPRDNLLQQFWVADHVDYVCFTDRDLINPPPQWKIVKVARTHEDPARDAKKYKMLPHVYLPGYDRSVWIDSNFQTTPVGMDELFDTMGDNDVLFFKHFSRNCTYQEAETCKLYGLDDPNLIDKQMAKYRAEGLEDGLGLPECNTILRKHTDRALRFGTIWYAETELGSKRDQLSVMYAGMKGSVRMAIMPYHARTGEWTRWVPHVHGRTKPKLIIATVVHDPEPDWSYNLMSLTIGLLPHFEISHRWVQGGPYLHKHYCELLGGHGVQDYDLKPFMAMDEEAPLDRDYDYILFFENDHTGVTPEHILKLVSRNVDVVGATYVLQDGATLPHHVMPRHEGAYCHATTELPVGNDLIPMKHAGMGCLLVRRGVIEQLEYPWFSPMLIQTSDQEGAKTGTNNQKTVTVFTYDKPGSMGWSGQDAGFGDRLLQVGIQPWIDPTVRIGHIKKKTFMPGERETAFNAALEEVAQKEPGIADVLLKHRKAV